MKGTHEAAAVYNTDKWNITHYNQTIQVIEKIHRSTKCLHMFIHNQFTEE